MSKSSTTTDPNWLRNPTPGEILLEEFLRPLSLSQPRLPAHCACRPAGSTRLCSASGRSPPTPICA